MVCVCVCACVCAAIGGGSLLHCVAANGAIKVLSLLVESIAMEMIQQDNVRSSLVPHAMIIIQLEMQTYMYMYLHNKRLTNPFYYVILSFLLLYFGLHYTCKR